MWCGHLLRSGCRCGFRFRGTRRHPGRAGGLRRRAGGSYRRSAQEWSASLTSRSIAATCDPSVPYWRRASSAIQAPSSFAARASRSRAGRSNALFRRWICRAQSAVRGKVKRTTLSDKAQPCPPDHVNRDFQPADPTPIRCHVRGHLARLQLCGVRDPRVRAEDRGLAGLAQR